MIYDVDQLRAAADLAARLPGWVVVWGAYHRRFSAFGACTPTCTILDDPDPDRLLDRMRDTQLALLRPRDQSTASRPYVSPPPAPATGSDTASWYVGPAVEGWS